MRTGSNTAASERRRALWVGFKPTHELTHLPEKLTRHEQGEGTILAVGVVAPLPSALEDQRKAYESQPTGDESGLKKEEQPEFHLPLPASDQLIRQWLSQLQEGNPGLSGATVVIRNKAEGPLCEESFEEKAECRQ